MSLSNPQASFEDSIFGPDGVHPTPKSLPFPSRPMTTIYGDTIEYLIPEEQKERILKQLFPFGDPPHLDATWMDIHARREFRIREFRVIEQNGYVMPVSPYFAEDGASVVDWEPKAPAADEWHIAHVADVVLDSAFNAGYADGFTGMHEGAAKPSRPDGMSAGRYREVEESYCAGYAKGAAARNDGQMPFAVSPVMMPPRRNGRRSRGEE